MHLYKISGLTIASEIALPGAWLLDCGTPDVVMRQGAVAPVLTRPLASSGIWEADEGRVLLRADGVGRFLITHGEVILFEPEQGVPAEACAPYLQGTGIGMLLNQRGEIVLHASAAAVDGKAMLFCGKSGEGKSTLAAALSVLGYATFSDDVSRITFDQAGRPFVSADARQLKLNEETIDFLNLEERRGGAVLQGSAKAYVSPPAQWGVEDLPLGAIYLLRSPPTATDRIVRLDAAVALRRLMRRAHRPGMMRGTGQSGRYFEANAKILQHASVFTLERRRGISRLQATTAMLENHWEHSSLGSADGSAS